jgi:hypothetical protein
VRGGVFYGTVRAERSASFALSRIYLVATWSNARIHVGAKNMIAGNPKTECTVLIIAAALATLVLLCTVFLSMRKKTDPQKEPPLHPSVVIVEILTLDTN